MRFQAWCEERDISFPLLAARLLEAHMNPAVEATSARIERVPAHTDTRRGRRRSAEQRDRIAAGVRASIARRRAQAAAQPQQPREE